MRDLELELFKNNLKLAGRVNKNQEDKVFSRQQ